MLPAFSAISFEVLLLFMSTFQQTIAVPVEENFAVQAITATCYLIEKGIILCSQLKNAGLNESVSLSKVGADGFKNKFQLKCTAECAVKNQQKVCSCKGSAYESLTHSHQNFRTELGANSEEEFELDLPKPINFLIFDSRDLTAHVPDEQTLFVREPSRNFRRSNSKFNIGGILKSVSSLKRSLQKMRSRERRNAQLATVLDTDSRINSVSTPQQEEENERLPIIPEDSSQLFFGNGQNTKGLNNKNNKMMLDKIQTPNGWR